MHHMHAIAHQIYEERVREAERRATFLTESGLPTLAPRRVVAVAPRPPRRLAGLLRLFRRAATVRSA